jgi:tetratricopeptide (TPR) repeat protein
LADIFVSYSRTDRKRVKPLVELFEEQGWSVWWDREVSPGESFEQLIDQQISQARVVVVVWSDGSIASRWVRNEALEAMERDILIPVRLDDCKMPVAFRQTQAADLTHWPRRVDETEMRMLLDAIGTELHQPRIADTGSRSSRSKRRSLLAWATVAICMMAAALSAWYLQSTDPVAEVPRLAILRMEPADQSTDEVFFADSLADEVLAVLNSDDRISISRRTASWEIPLDLSRSEIAERLKVDFLLQGKVSQSAQTEIQISVFDAAEDEPVLLKTFSSLDRDVQYLRLEIGNAVIGALMKEDPGHDGPLGEPVYDQEAYNRYLRAKDLLRRSGETGELTTARDLLIQATQRDPSLGAAFAGLCRVHLGLYKDTGATRSFEEAERACHRALTLRRKNADIYLALGELNEMSGQYERARSEYNQALRIDPFMVDALSGIGYTLAMQDEPLKAERAFREAVNLQPGYWRSHNAIGWFYVKQGRLQEAIEAYTQVTYLAPTNAWGYANLGAARFGAGDFSGAIQDWQHANSIDPESGAISNIGTAHFYLREFDQAAAMYTQALTLAPDDYRLWINLGDALRFLEVPDIQTQHAAIDAHAAYRRAIEFAARDQTVNPSQATAWSAQAVAFAFLGEFAQASSKLTKALEIASDDPAVRYHAALAEISSDNLDLAIEHLRRAATLGYPNAFVSHDPLLDRLRELPAFDVFTTPAP